MKLGYSNNFVSYVTSEISPFQHLSGTEHVAPLLYSLIRMLRPETVVEFGTGYTTPFILQALQDNYEDFRIHQGILRKKARKRHVELGDFSRHDMEIEKWWLDEVTQDVYGGEPILPAPSYYLKSYKPHLFSFDVLPDENSYIKKLREVVKHLSLDKLLSLHAGARVKNYVDVLPADRNTIDFAWNDFGNKFFFFEETYKSLNGSGGIIAFHNTTNSEKEFKEDLDRVVSRIDKLISSRECELITFLEPHKFTQRSLTILQKKSNFKEEYFENSRGSIDRDMLKLSRSRQLIFP